MPKNNKDINLEGIKDLGKGFGTQIVQHTKKNNPRVIVGHDYRSYSEDIKTALKDGLKSTGCNVEDVGLSLSPMVYFAQFNLEADAVAMVTASHNENGWTGVKMGIQKGLTHAPEEMKELKDITLNKKFISGKGNEKKIENLESTIQDLQAQQLEISNNIITLIQHAETMNNVTDASGLLAEHVTDLENRLNIVIDWMKEEIRIRNLN